MTGQAVTRPRITVVAAMAHDNAIGLDGRMPWHLPEDLKHMRALTMGHPVIMGRKTWDSLPDKFRPLPGRTNIVVSRDPAFAAAGAVGVASLQEAFRAGAVAEGGDEVFVIGGAQIYAAALVLADSLVLTEIDAAFPADTYFPRLEPGQWDLVSRDARVSATGLVYAIAVFDRHRAYEPAAV